MAINKLYPNDPRIQHKYAVLRGQKYHYLHFLPEITTPKATLFLIHGFPDTSFGWRYQIPYLMSQNYQLVVPDMMGYGRSAAPRNLEFYTVKRAADDMAELATQLGVKRLILLGHDWGGEIVWKMAHWHPELVSALVVICTPYAAPLETFIPLEEMVARGMSNFKYQIQLAGREVEERVVGRVMIKQFLNGMFGGWNRKDGKSGFTTEAGILFENLASLDRSKLLSEEELDYYTESYSHNGLGGVLNWYRTRELNFSDEKVLTKIEDPKMKVPTLFIKASKDEALPAWMSKNMGRHFKDLTVQTVEAHHWALWEAPDICNAAIGNFLDRKTRMAKL